VIDALLSFWVPVNHFWFLQAVFIFHVRRPAGMARDAASDDALVPAVRLRSGGVSVATVQARCVRHYGAIYLLPFFVVRLSARKC